MRLTIAAHGAFIAVGPSGKVGDGAQVLLELRSLAAFCCPMPRIVDARRDLVSDQSPSPT